MTLPVVRIVPATMPTMGVAAVAPTGRWATIAMQVAENLHAILPQQNPLKCRADRRFAV